VLFTAHITEQGGKGWPAETNSTTHREL